MSTSANIKLKDVKELCIQNSSCVKKIFSSYTILLHPMYLNNIKNGVRIELDSMLKSYCKQLKGIVMGYEGVKISSSSGWIFDTNPFLHVNLVADFYVFSPEIGSVLRGKVVKKSPNHVGCLVHNIFNASSSIPNGIIKSEWCGNKVSEGDSLEMKITEINLTCAVPFLRGDIISESICLMPKNECNLKIKEEPVEDEDSGISCMEKLHDEDTDDENKKKKKKKKRLQIEEEDDKIPIKQKKRKSDNLDNSKEDSDGISGQQKKRIKFNESLEIKSEENEVVKKRKKKEDSLETSFEERLQIKSEEINEESPKKKKKKKTDSFEISFDENLQIKTEEVNEDTKKKKKKKKTRDEDV